MATERITIVVEERGTRVVQRRLADVGGAAKDSEQSVKFLQNALLSLGSVVVLRAAVRTLANFEQAMATVRAITGATDDQFKDLLVTARELGATTRFTASEAADGMVFLARAGFTVEETLKTISGTLQLAQAGALDFGRAADIATNVLRGFRLGADEVGRAIDVLALAANRTNSNVSELGDALKFAAPVAAGTAVSIEETTAAVGALSDAGLKASLAGTGLRRVISELEAPNTKTVKILRNLGLTTQEVRVSQVGLTEALVRLRDAGLSTGLALEVFGDRGGPAFEVLSANIDNVRRLTQMLQQAGGTAQEIARIMDDNLNGALLAVRSRLEAVLLAMGELGASHFLTQFMRGLADVLAFTAANVELLAGALTGLAIAVIPRLVRVLRILAVAIAGTGIGAIAVVVGTAIGALTAFRDEIRLTKDGLATLGDFGRASLELISVGIGDILEAARRDVPAIRLILDGMLSDFDFSLAGFLRTTARLMDLWVGVWMAAFASVRTLADGFGLAVLDVFTRLVNRIIGLMEFVLDAAGALFLGVGRFLGNMVLELSAPIQALGSMIEQLLVGNVQAAAVHAAQATSQAAAHAARMHGQLMDDLNRNVLETFRMLNAGDMIPRLPSAAEGSLERLGQDLGESFVRGFLQSQGNLTEAVEFLLSRAEQIAQERITAAEVEEAARLARAGGIGRDAPPSEPVLPRGFEHVLTVLREQQDLLRMTARAREIHSESLRIENELLLQNIELTDDQRGQLKVELERIHLLTQLASVLDDIRGNEIDLAAAQEELNSQVAEGAITAEQARLAFLRLQEAVLEMDKSVLGGFRRGFARVREELQDFASVSENALVNAFQSAEDAFVKFVRTGEVSFREFVDSILSDLARLAFRQAASGLIESLLGGINFGGARQHGGPVLAGRSYLVGEEGPELVRFPATGQVFSNQETARMLGSESGPGGSTVINVTFHIQAHDAADVRRNARSVERDFVTALRRGAERR